MSPKSIEIGRKRVHVKDDGKSSSEKLRRVAGYLFYVRDPQKTSSGVTFSTQLSKTGKLQISEIHLGPSLGPPWGPPWGDPCRAVVRDVDEGGQTPTFPEIILL